MHFTCSYSTSPYIFIFCCLLLSAQYALIPSMRPLWPSVDTHSGKTINLVFTSMHSISCWCLFTLTTPPSKTVTTITWVADYCLSINTAWDKHWLMLGQCMTQVVMPSYQGTMHGPCTVDRQLSVNEVIMKCWSQLLRYDDMSSLISILPQLSVHKQKLNRKQPLSKMQLYHRESWPNFPKLFM